MAPNSLWRRSWSILADAYGHLNDDDGWAMASHVALASLMAVFPFFIFVAALAAFVGEADLADRVATLLFDTWPQDLAKPIAEDVSAVLTQTQTSLLTISAAITIFLASNGVEAVRTALNRAYRVTETRSIFFRRAQSVVFVLIGAVASLVFAFIGVLGSILFDWIANHFPAIQPYGPAFEVARFVVAGLLAAAVLIAAHLWLPSGRPPALRLWPGILATLAMWLIAAWAFGFYLQRFAHYAAYYASLASVVSAIFFLYLMAVIMVFGAEFNAALSRIRAPIR